MKRKIETKFYTFNQNNSGGYFIYNDEFGVAEFIIIEAQNANEAWNKLEKIGDNVNNFWEFCSCCGDRWSNYMDDDDGTEEPMIYDEKAKDFHSDYLMYKKCYIHYYDNKIEEINLIKE